MRAATDLAVWGPEGHRPPCRSSCGGPAQRCWTGPRCPARHNSPATGPVPGSDPSAAPAGGRSSWAAAVGPAPVGVSPSRSHREEGRPRGPPRSPRDGRMTRSCPRPWRRLLRPTWAGCNPSCLGSPASPPGAQTRPGGAPPAGRAWASSGPQGCSRSRVGTVHLPLGGSSQSGTPSAQLRTLGGAQILTPLVPRTALSPCPHLSRRPQGYLAVEVDASPRAPRGKRYQP